MDSFIGHSFGRYHIIEKLGEGGMATVYKAYDTRLERDVAVKVIRKDAFSNEIIGLILKRFEREAKAMARLNHSNIVKVFDFGEHEGFPYLVMELLSGGTLKDRLGKPIPWQDAVLLLEPVARALGYAHEKGILHRDVKPSNILITEKNEPVLTDFGIAKLLGTEEGQTLTGTGVGVGTPEYMAPEQGLNKDVDGRADIYALGIILFEMVTGRKPYSADTPFAILLKQINDPLPDPRIFLKDIPDIVNNVIYKAMAKKPEDRFQNMNEFELALRNIRPQLFLFENMQKLEPQVNQMPAINQNPSPSDTFNTVDQLDTEIQKTITHPKQPRQSPPPPVPTTKQGQTSKFKTGQVIGLILAGFAFLLLIIGVPSGWFRSKPTNLPYVAPVYTETPTDLSSSPTNIPPETFVTETKVPEEDQGSESTTTINNNFSVPPSFFGIWVNEDSQTRSITQVNISNNVYPNSIEIWGSCSPTDCFWNSDPNLKYEITQVVDNSMEIVWTFDFIECVMNFELLSDGRIQINTQNHFTDDSNRDDYLSTDYFIASENLLNFEGLWIGTLDEVTGDMRSFDLNINFFEVSSENVTGSRYAFLINNLFEENSIQSGSLDGTNLRFMDEEGRYFWGKISQNQINGFISWDCYECGYWGTFAVRKSFSD